MTFLELLQNLKPTRRSIFGRMYGMRREIKSLLKKTNMSRRRILHILRTSHYQQWTSVHDVVRDMVILVNDLRRVCDVGNQHVVLYLAGYLPNKNMVMHLNRATLSPTHISK